MTDRPTPRRRRTLRRSSHRSGIALAELAHTSLEFEDDEAVLDQLAVELPSALREGDALLVCLPRRRSEALRRRLAPDVVDEVTWLSAAERYARPIDAMSELWSFTRSSLQAGARRVRSIGEIEFSGEPSADAPWHWYEAAVNRVFAEAPLVATCLVDTARTPDHVLSEIRRVHPACSHGGVTHRSEQFVADPWTVPQLLEVAVPDAPPTASLALVGREDLAVVRERIEQVAAPLGAAVLQRMLLVATELATNALLHGGGAAGVALWVDDAGAVLQVTDDGPGLDDPYASIRPPDLPVQGAGLWVAHVESDQLHLASAPGSTTVTARFDR